MPSLSDLQNVFPTKFHAFIFVGYIALFVNQGILITSSKDKKNGYPYNPTTTVLLSEFFKMTAAAALFTKETGLSSLFKGLINHSRVMIMYFVPAFLYCIYNNLAFINLASYDPTSYYVLLQFRVVFTGVFFQVLFNRRLSRTQWFSLCLLTIGCIVKQLDTSKGGMVPTLHLEINARFGLIIFQTLCSCFAGVYNEYLLKGKGEEVPFMIQNVYMYMDSVLCNVIFLTYNGQLVDAFTADSIKSILQLKVVLIIMTNAAIGITTAMFLHTLNSILKTFAAAMELMFTAVLSWIIFGIPINIATVFAVAVIIYASSLYVRNPVDNTPKAQQVDLEASGDS